MCYVLATPSHLHLFYTCLATPAGCTTPSACVTYLHSCSYCRYMKHLTARLESDTKDFNRWRRLNTGVGNQNGQGYRLDLVPYTRDSSSDRRLWNYSTIQIKQQRYFKQQATVKRVNNDACYACGVVYSCWSCTLELHFSGNYLTTYLS